MVVCPEAVRARTRQGAKAIAAVSEFTAAVPGVPYRGIHPFRLIDHPIFFAREEETISLVSLVSVYRGVMLYGDSGSGKSSLVNAGLIPEALEAGLQPERIRVQPRAAEELVVERIAIADDDEQEWLPSVLATETDSSARSVFSLEGFEDRVRDGCERHRPLLIFDQFEEVVTLFDEVGARDRQGPVIDLLVRLLRSSLPLKVLLSFREDYLGKVKELLRVCPELVDQALRIAPLAADTLPTIIAGPFLKYPDHFARELSPALMDRLAGVLGDRYGNGELSLSEVQTVCLRLWQSDDADALLADKGPEGLLEDYLGESIDEMPPDLRSAAVALLGQMVTSAGTRNVISAEDLFARVREVERKSTPARLEQALARLSESRLVRREHRRDIDLYEITSEFLVPWISRRRDALQRAQERHRLYIVGSIAAVLVLVAVGMAALAVWALAQRSHARTEATRATSLALASAAQINAASRPDVGLVLSLAALTPYRAGPGSPALARSSMIAALETARAQGVVGIFGCESGSADAVAVSPDGRTLAAGCDDGTVLMWDLASRRQIGSPLRTTPGLVYDIAFAPDGRTLAEAGADGKVRLWDLATHRQVASLSGRGLVYTVAFSPDGRTLAGAGADGSVSLWDSTTHRRLGSPLSAGAGRVIGVAFTPGGHTLLAATSMGRVRSWDLATRRPLGSKSSTSFGPSYSVAFSPDRRALAAGSNGRVTLWNVTTGKRLGAALTAPTGPVESVAFSPDGRTLAFAGYDGRVRLWDVATRKRLDSLAAAAGVPIFSLAFTPDGRRLAAGGLDGTVRMWDLAAHRAPGSPLVTGSPVESIAFSPGGRTLAAGTDDGTVQLWDIPAHRQLRAPLTAVNHGSTYSVAFSPGGRAIAAGGQSATVRMWSAATHQPLAAPLIARDSNGGVVSVAFSPGGRTLAAGTHAGTVSLWDPATGEGQGSLPSSGYPIESVAFSPDGSTLATAGDDGTLRLWDPATRKERRALPVPGGFPIYSVAFSPDGRMLATGSDDGTVRLWDPATGKEIGSLPTPSPSAVFSVAFSPDGRTLAAGTNDGHVRLWDTSTREPLGTPLSADGDQVNSVAFSPDGHILAAGSADGTVRLWSGFAWTTFADLRNQVCGLVGGGLSRAEWAQFAPGIAYRDDCR